MSYFDTFESNSAKPSWCLDVMMMYFMPASAAVRTQASASYFTGLNARTNCSYSLTGTCARLMIHSPMSATRSPW